MSTVSKDDLEPLKALLDQWLNITIQRTLPAGVDTFQITLGDFIPTEGLAAAVHRELIEPLEKRIVELEQEIESVRSEQAFYGHMS